MLAVNRLGFLDTEAKPGFENGTVTNWVSVHNILPSTNLPVT